MSKSGITILNIGAGKFGPVYAPNRGAFIVNLDLNYFNPIEVGLLERLHKNHISLLEPPFSTSSFDVNCDVYKFLSSYKNKFDRIVMNRFLEHVPKAKLLEFLYLLSTAVEIDGILDVIVPDFKVLANRILTENVNDPDFERDDMITTYELLNEPSCPHASIWTKERILRYIEFERRFKVTEIIENFEYDGWNGYLRFFAKRVDGR